MKTKLLGTVVLMATLGLAGCAGWSTQQKAVATCASVTSAVDVLVAQSDRFTPDVLEQVESVVAEIQPICGEGDVPTTDKIKQVALERALGEINGLLLDLEK